jgi:hypothetical protein
VERGHLDRVALLTICRIAAVLDVRVDVVARWRGGELDRLLGARHSALADAVAAHLSGSPGWVLAPEVSFSIYGERGIIDILAFHRPTGSLLVIELKTAIVDVKELVGSVDRKRRLATRIAATGGKRGRWIDGDAIRVAPSGPARAHQSAERRWTRPATRKAGPLGTGLRAVKSGGGHSPPGVTSTVALV